MGAILGWLVGGVSATGVIAWILNVVQGSQKSPRFSFVSEGWKADIEWENGYQVCHQVFDGVVCNTSLVQNSLLKVWVAVWVDESKTSFLWMSSGNITVIDRSKNESLGLPRMFAAREGITVGVHLRIHGLQDERTNKLVFAMKDVCMNGRTAQSMIPKYSWELLFEDLNHNLFDSGGRLLNLREINLRFRLPSERTPLISRARLKHVRALWPIYVSRLSFWIRSTLMKLGYSWR